MKTIEEIREHLTKTAYTNEAMTKIMGFLIGAGLKEPSEVMYIARGASTFEDFFEWFNDEECDCCCDCVLCSIINDISKRLENADDDEERAYYAEQLAFLLDAFDLIDDEE